MHFLIRASLLLLAFSVAIFAATSDAFVITVKTDNTGNSSDTQFTIPVNASATYNYNVDCEDDGIVEATNQTGSYTCTYETAGTYTIAITGAFPHLYFLGASDPKKLLEVNQWGTQQWSSMYATFYGCSNLTIPATDTPDLSRVTSMTYTFSDATAFNSDIGDWNVSSVTSMSGMFRRANTFNQPIGNWDVSAVTDISAMFYSASAFNQDIGNWDVSLVTNMGSLFYDATAFNQDITHWDVSSVTDMNHMFFDAAAFDQNISRWNVSSVTTMDSMFYGASAFNHDIGEWNVSSVTDMSGMFGLASTFNQDIGRWDVSSVTTMSYMFSNAPVFNQDIGDWNVSSVNHMDSMFRATAEFNYDISDWNVSSVTNMHSMFFAANAFNQDISSWDVSSVTIMENMFLAAHAFNQDISSWDVSSVTRMSYMFFYASAFNQDLSDWNISSVAEMGNMFSYNPLSISHYDALLESWSSQNVQSDVAFTGQTYCLGEAGRNILTDTYNWVITDDGKDCGFYILSDSDVNASSRTVMTLDIYSSYGNPITYSIAGGADAALFSVNENGTLRFINQLDVDTPLDANGDNVYRVALKATDGTYEDVKTFSVTVSSNKAVLVPVIHYLLF